MRKLKISPPTLRLNTTVIVSVILLLVASVSLVFYQSYETLKQEVVQNSEETLEATVLQVDNIMRCVEQTTGNIYYDMMLHFNDLERMPVYTRKMVESNPYIYGCAIAFDPVTLGGGMDRFLVYTHRKKFDSSELVTSNRYSEKPYMEQAWYLDPAETGQIFWMVPHKDIRNNDVPLLLYCIPIRFANDQVAAVIAVEVSMDLLTEVIEAAKPSPNSYCMLLDSDGSFIIHPDHSKLRKKTVFEVAKEEADTTMLSTAKAILSGESGYKSYRAKGKEYYAFYKPFLHSDKGGHFLYGINWSISLIYPKEDITAAYRGMFVHALTITAIALLVFFMLCRIVLRRQLKPLRKVAEAAEEIAEGNFGEEIPKSRSKDEVGEFLRHFKRLRDVLYAKVTEQDQMTAELHERRELLRKTYEQIQEDNDVKKNFLHNMTNKMIAPAKALQKSINTFCDDYQNISMQDATLEVGTIREQRETILETLNQILNTTDPEVRKEDSHE